MRKILTFEDRPVDKQLSLSMLMKLGAIMADGARAEALEQRERLRRRFAGSDDCNLTSLKPEREQISCPAASHSIPPSAPRGH